MADFERTYSVNVRGTFLCYKYAAVQMVAKGRGGRLIGATSNLGKQGAAGFSSYCATKFAVRGMTQSAAIEFAKFGITVNAYAAGAIDTPMRESSCHLEELKLTKRVNSAILGE